MRLLEAAFSDASQPDYLDSAEGAVGVAAAQVVAWLLNPEAAVGSSYSSSAVAWVKRSAGQPDSAMLDATRRALHRVQGENSELAALWDETGDDAWRVDIERIEQSLDRGASPT